MSPKEDEDVERFDTFDMSVTNTVEYVIFVFTTNGTGSMNTSAYKIRKIVVNK